VIRRYSISCNCTPPCVSIIDLSSASPHTSPSPSQATDNVKSIMKSLEKGKALEESENKKIVELTGRVLSDTIKLILDVLSCPL
jgi:uncharacterized protein (DUF1499 family)